MKRISAVMPVILAGLIFTFNLYAAGGGQQGQSGPVTLTSNFTGVGKIDHGLAWHMLLTHFNVEIDRIAQGVEALQTALAGGNLPDIVSISGEQFFQGVEAGLLLNLDNHKDKLPHVHANIAAGLEYNRDQVKARNLPAGAYAVPSGTTNLPSWSTNKYEVGVFLRWDYYYQMGHPELKTLDDYLPLLKEMLQRFPVDENGRANLGMSFYTDNEAGMGYVAEAMRYAKIHGQVDYGYLEVDVAKKVTRSIFDDDSYYKKGLQFLFKANQEGLLDPNSITQTFAQWHEKTATGRILFHTTGYSWTNFWTDEKERQGIYYGFVPFMDMRIPNNVLGPRYTPGAPGGLAISAKTKYLDKALAVLDYMWSYDGFAELYYGFPNIEGGIWDIIDGKPVPRGTFDPNTGGVAVIAGGAAYPLYNTEFQRTGLSDLGGNVFGVSSNMIHPAWGESLYYLGWSSWDISMDPANLFEAQRMEVYGKYGITNNGVAELTRKMGLELEVKPWVREGLPENMQLIYNRVAAVAHPAGWRMILARNQAEFDQIWTEMKREINGIGLPQLIEWYRSSYERGLNATQKYIDIWNNTEQLQ
jgi:putative aldouronate transport system substrate-binding protein